MTEPKEITVVEVDAYYLKLKSEAEKFGYYLNPDVEFTKDLVMSLLVNKERFGYEACPCRLADENRTDDLDIICPCDYRDADVSEQNACYCALYVSRKASLDPKIIKSIPDRRPVKKMRLKMKEEQINNAAPANRLPELTLPVYRCKVCGYLCARPEAPDVCPICKVTKDRFERFA